MWHLARAATALRVRCPEMTELAEATAALQDLAIGLTDEPEATGRLAELAELQAGLSPGIQATTDGPYLVTGAARLLDWLGRPLPVRPQTRAVPLRRVGDQAALRRHPCHASDSAAPRTRTGSRTGATPIPASRSRLRQPRHLPALRLLHRPPATVFHQRGDPFVTPSGGRWTRSSGAVRDCPSGALATRIDGARQRRGRPTRPARAAPIEVTKDGPYRVTGAIPLTDADGEDEPRNAGRLTRALRAVPLRTLAERAVLQRHALVRRASTTRCPTRTGSRRCSSGPAGYPR